MPRLPMKAAGALNVGDYVNWRSEGTYYRVSGAEVKCGGWAFLHLDGHPLRVVNIWHTVEMPWHR